MTDTHTMVVLSVSDCWDLLAGTALGRLVTTVDGVPAIFPVNYTVQDRTVLFRTAQGTKLVSAAINNNVLFEADGYSLSEGWSVIVAGVARSVRSEEDIAEAERAGLISWTDSEKEHFVRIHPRGVTGRRFRFRAQPGTGTPAEDPILG
ncbi:pyridoxamine 5'-phosphate oxidase family protein [Mycolicibacterium diernhoferi]|uniref:Pyridoxamine 5'-phosphate oxidase n=1 Tax=Mycolicibacterium diernhoferi TaxID=1801 RepID=A0A1Q4HEU2_9MYCO|nr:pyridoxamine 5'-phosphate oxidase family protein [Mycolicibacterium diernhoferi]OJZ66005.1 pyridoxamine 5'-phosphate oxidase [Mycolicibacterium diernhoferi]OPE55027.1 pyridoxamine 5'-phosphate oxidase [Mycolicibacterium diernhoferi]PEG54632.1 pyridoxamine 5'-phosphate oxidase family protein [Mycolicibacterium diernhoferi]QYL23911.1 pyridoxamine 5'-phosphate oxidase family protein [Mycolicibacterium diernhoferi]